MYVVRTVYNRDRLVTSMPSQGSGEFASPFDGWLRRWLKSCLWSSMYEDNTISARFTGRGSVHMSMKHEGCIHYSSSVKVHQTI